jgi:GH25 family lysozyme M1 (1,4-beta-N-acetylmuramidase)
MKMSDYLFGTDVSHYQKAINWAKVKQRGQGDFSIIKLMYESSRRKDEFFELNYSGCKKNNIPVGIYLFIATKSIENPGEDVKKALEHLKGRKLELGIWLDYESDVLKKAGKKRIKELSYFYKKEFEKANYKVNIYCNYYWFENIIPSQIKKDFLFWIARYKKNDDGFFSRNSKLSPENFAIGWQYSSKGKINGINGNVDLDVFFNSSILSKDIRSVALDVISGKYGNGKERIQKLSLAGYSAAEVQREVNRILKEKK